MKKQYAIIGLLVLVLTSIVGFGTYYISSSYIALDQEEVSEASAMLSSQLTFNPIQGNDTNVVSMIKNTLASTISSRTNIKIVSSSSPQIASDGTITYGKTPTTATVTVKIGRRHSYTTRRITIVIPGATSTTTAPAPVTTTPATAPTGSFSVKDYGAKGDGSTNDTTAIQNAVNYSSTSGKTVYFPDGTYLVNPDTKVVMKNNSKVNLGNATIKSTASTNGWYAIFYALNVSNVEIYGGTIIGDRAIHTGTSGEWGAGINISGSNNVYVHDVNVNNCWGDGIYIGSSSSQNYSRNVRVENFTMDNNRRNGVAVVSSKDSTIRNGSISNTNGTAPQDGIVIAPNYPTEWMNNLLIENIKTYNNKGFGIALTFWFYGGSTNPVNVTFRDNVDSGSTRNADYGIGTKPFIEKYVESPTCKVTITSTATTTPTTTTPTTTTPPTTTAPTTTTGDTTSPTTTGTIPAGAFNVTSYGANGGDQSDDTAAINSAITAAYNKGGGTVYIPNGTYMVNPDTSVSLKSNVNLLLADGATLKALPTANGNYRIVKIVAASNVSVTGGNIVGERNQHLGTNGEWGMGISVLGSNNIHIYNISISDCWGDGIYVAGSSVQNYSQNVLIENFNITNNRRDGISIISAKDLTIKNGTTSYSSGTNPQSGIILEPNVPTEFMQNILITNVYSHHNGLNWQAWYCYGIGVAFGHYENNTNPYSVTITNSRLVDNGRDYDNEQLNNTNITLYKNNPNRWNGTITVSGITYTP